MSVTGSTPYRMKGFTKTLRCGPGARTLVSSMASSRNKYKNPLTGEVAFSSPFQFAQAVRAANKINELATRAFGEITQFAKPSGIERITKEQWKDCRTMIIGGTSPHVAAQLAFGISPYKFSEWMKLGRDEGGLYYEFYQHIKAAELQARAVAESRVYVEDPELWLLKGPVGKTKPSDPGWTDEKINKLQGPDDEEGNPTPARMRLEFTPMGGTVTKPILEGVDDAEKGT